MKKKLNEGKAERRKDWTKSKINKVKRRIEESEKRRE